MKKLLFATAIAASAAAFADPINAVAFENGGDYNPNGANSYFYFAGESDSSVVTNTSPSTAKRTAYFAEANNANYLALDTEGGTLWRSLGEIDIQTDAGTNIYSLGTARAVAASGTYLDTLVQFTVTEDEAPTVGAGDKLAIWLQAEEGVTNLMVRAGYVDDDGTSTSTTSKDYVLSNAIVPGQWYRLTVKAIQDVTKCKEKNPEAYSEEFFTGFEVYIDDVLQTADSSSFSQGYIDLATGANEYGWLDATADAEFITYLTSGKVFASLGGAKTVSQLQGVGFQGTGAVDEIVWTEEDPFPAQTIGFTLTWTDSEVSAVSYVLSTDLATTNSLTSGTAVQLAPGDGTATIELIPTFTTGYEFDKVTMGETELGLTFAIPGVTTNATLLAKAAAAAYPTYVGDNAALKTQYDTWKTTYGADSESAYEKQFLLNVAPATTVADDALKIDSITEVQDGWKIVVSTTVSGAALSKGTETFTTSYNGYLTVLAADTLADLSNNPTAVDYPVTAIAGGKVEITVTAGKFMKVQLTNTPGTKPAQN